MPHVKRNVAAYVALSVTLSASAYAAATLQKNSVTGYHVNESSLRTVPRAEQAVKTRSQVMKVLKLDESVGEPPAAPTLLRVGTFTFKTTCRKTGDDTIMEIDLTAPHEFILDGGGDGTNFVFRNWHLITLYTTSGYEQAKGKSLTFSASIQAGPKSQVLSGHVAAWLHHWESDCVANFSLLRN